jgi:hypothetical protein
VGPLGDIGKNKKEPLPELRHPERAMGCISMLKKRLRKQRQIPYGNKKN